jgi:aminodeoxyfutalosine synthase
MLPLSDPKDIARLQRRSEQAGLGSICAKVLEGERLSSDDALALYATPDYLTMGMLANHVRERIHGDLTYFNINQHINYTNVCPTRRVPMSSPPNRWPRRSPSNWTNR